VTWQLPNSNRCKLASFSLDMVDSIEGGAQIQVKGAYSEYEVELLRASRVVQLCAKDQVVDWTNVKGVPQLQVL